jgi:hypothetical protein
VVLSHAILSHFLVLFLGNSGVSTGIFLRVMFLDAGYAALISPLIFEFLKPTVS